jgi:hypothetical protein
MISHRTMKNTNLIALSKILISCSRRRKEADGLQKLKPSASSPRRLLIVKLVASTLLAVTGCGRHKAISRMTTGSTDGRQLSVVIDGKASFKTRGSEHVVTFRGHELVVGNERLVVDRDKKSFGIPSAAKRVDIEVNDGVLTMSVDGSLLIKTPI